MKPGGRVLEVGAGSGYAAAALGRIAGRVHAVERHPSLATAASRLGELGYDNVELHVGDGTLGWPEAAPFDAILVSAGGPGVPPALREQLAIGGRLVIPVGGGRGGRGCRGSPARARPGTRRRTSAASRSCRWSASRAGPRTMALG